MSRSPRLSSIRDGRLYRATHRTFESYLRERWSIGRSHGYRMIEAGRELARVREVSPNGDVPKSEAQTRELAKLNTIKSIRGYSMNVRAKIVERVEREGGWGNVSAADVARIRDEEVRAWTANQRRAESRGRGRAFVNDIVALGRGDWSLADDFDLTPPFGLSAEEHENWMSHIFVGLDALLEYLPPLRAELREGAAQPTE